MIFKAHSSRIHLRIWGSVIILVSLMAILMNWSINLSLLMLSAPAAIFISGQLGLSMEKYVVDEDVFKIYYDPFTDVISAPFDTLIGVRSIKISLYKQIYSGYPPLGLEVFFEGYGSYVLYTEDEKLCEIFDTQFTENNIANFPIIAATL